MFRRERPKVGRICRKEGEGERQRVHAYIYMCIHTHSGHSPRRNRAHELRPGGHTRAREGKVARSVLILPRTHSHILLNFLTRLPYSYYRELILILYSTSLLDFLLSLNIPIQSLLILREGCKVSITRVREK